VIRKLIRNNGKKVNASDLEYICITSPFAGTITSKNIFAAINNTA
jgi:hypothetical protein